MLLVRSLEKSLLIMLVNLVYLWKRIPILYNIIFFVYFEIGSSLLQKKITDEATKFNNYQMERWKMVQEKLDSVHVRL